MKEELNTNHFSMDPIYINKWGPRMYIDNKTIEECIEILKNLQLSTKDLINAKVHCDVEEDYESGRHTSYIGICGMKLETKKEYEERLKGIIFQLKNEQKRWEERKSYYEDGGIKVRINDYEAVLEKSKNKEECH